MRDALLNKRRIPIVPNKKNEDMGNAFIFCSFSGTTYILDIHAKLQLPQSH
jgi:hypothetical protein